MSLPFFILFIIISLVQLYAGYTDRLTLKAYSKGYIVTSLIAFYLFSASEINRFFLLALVLCMLGDVLLLSRNTFVMGGVSFLAAHICFCTGYAGYIDLKVIPVLPPVIFSAAMIFVIILIIRAVNNGNSRKMIIAASSYMTSVMIHTMFSLCLLLTSFSVQGIMVFFGSLLFFFSDCLVVLRQFKKETKFKKISFVIMLTYIFALALITIGYLKISQ